MSSPPTPALRGLLFAAQLVALATLAPEVQASPLHGCHARESARHHASHSSGHAGSTAAAGSGGLFSFAEVEAQPCHLAFVDLPDGWVATDSHTHHEECDAAQNPQRYLYDHAALANIWMAGRDIMVSTPLLWGYQVTDTILVDPLNLITFDGHLVQLGPWRKLFENQWSGLDLTAAPHVDLLTGEAASFELAFPTWTTASPPWETAERARILQSGIEVSGWTASGLGHFTALNVPSTSSDLLFPGLGCSPQWDGGTHLTGPDPLAEPFDFRTFVEHVQCACPGPPPLDAGHKNDGTGDYSLPLIRDAFKDGNPETVIGYAHHVWPSELVVEDSTGNVGWEWETHLADLISTPNLADQLDTRCFPTTVQGFPSVRAGIPDNFEGSNTLNPVLAATDVAMNWVDFIESVTLGVTIPAEPGTPAPAAACDCVGGPAVTACGEEDHHSPPEQDPFGMYYKLLSAGQRVALSAGSDQDCGAPCAPQSYVYVGNALDAFEANAPTDPAAASTFYDEYVQAMAAGRTSLSLERYQFLDMTVDGAPIGSELHASTATMVDVEVHFEVPDTFVTEFTTSPSFSTEDRTLEIVTSGDCCLAPGPSCPFRSHEVVWSHTLTAGDFTQGVFTNGGLPISVAIPKSAWLAVRTSSGSAHTAASFVIVDDLPIANALDAEYWMIYSEYVRYKIRAYQECAVTYGIDEMFERHVGCSASEIDQHLVAGREIFESFRDLALDPPTVTRYGTSGSSDCEDPIALSVGGQPNGGPDSRLRLACVNAPPDASGFLLLATNLTTGISSSGIALPFPFNGAEIYFFPDANLSLFAQANHGGHASVEFPIPTAGLPPGLAVYAQFLWLPESDCGPNDAWTRGVAVQLN